MTTSFVKAKLQPVAVDLHAWLATRARELVLEETWRFGSSVLELAQQILPAHAATLKVAAGSQVETVVRIAELSASCTSGMFQGIAYIT